MLIEAAYSLPKWLRPEVAANRVWIRGGALHLIPQPPASGKGPGAALPPFPTRVQALSLLRQPPQGVTTLAGQGLRQAIKERLGGYPEAALEQVWAGGRLVGLGSSAEEGGCRLF